MSRPVEGLGLCLLLWGGAMSAEEPAPDPDLLVFLGEWATDDGGWMDPGNLMEANELDDEGEATGEADRHDDAD